jgi:hypothetical protein
MVIEEAEASGMSDLSSNFSEGDVNNQVGAIEDWNDNSNMTSDSGEIEDIDLPDSDP